MNPETFGKYLPPVTHSEDVGMSAAAHLAAAEPASRPPTLSFPPIRLVSVIESKPEQTPYTELEVAARLERPDGHATGLVFDSPSFLDRYPDRIDLSDARQAASVYQEEQSDPSYFSDSRKIYTGPTYLQGSEPTCGAWAAIHALQVIGIQPSTAVARSLLNRALPQHAKPGGLNVFAAGGILVEHSELGVDVDVPVVVTRYGRPDTGATIEFVKQTLDNGAAIIAGIKTEGSHHGICIAGYDIKDGHMRIQYLDSNWGERVMSVEHLIERIEHTNATPFAVIRRTSDTAPASPRQSQPFSLSRLILDAGN